MENKPYQNFLGKVEAKGWTLRTIDHIDGFNRKATRKITGFDNFGRPLVRYAGWSDFIVQPFEIISVKGN